MGRESERERDRKTDFNLIHVILEAGKAKICRVDRLETQESQYSSSSPKAVSCKTKRG